MGPDGSPQRGAEAARRTTTATETEFGPGPHGFELWFQSVLGYLAGRPFGRRSETAAPALPRAERQRLVAVLCAYAVGERTALEGASGLVRRAPNASIQIFLATQAVDEARHLEVLLHRLAELGVRDPEQEVERLAPASLKRFRRELLERVEQGQWEASLFAQNVLLEAMEFAAFQAHARRADPATAEVLEGIVKDERRHLGFGENQLGRRLRSEASLRRLLAETRARLDPLVMASFEEGFEHLGIPRSEWPDLVRPYAEALDRLGIPR